MWTDGQGRDWRTTVTVATVKRTKEMLGVLLTDAADADLVTQLYDDVILLADVLYVVCKPQADERAVTSDQFGELLAGDCIDKACESLMEDLLDFFQPSRRAAAAKKMHVEARKHSAIVKAMAEMMTDQQMDEAVEREIVRAKARLAERLAEAGSDSGRLPESSG